jgi:hypothetical protein
MTGIPLSAWGNTRLTGALRFKDGRLQQGWERTLTQRGPAGGSTDVTRTWKYWRDVPSVGLDEPDGEDGKGVT